MERNKIIPKIENANDIFQKTLDEFNPQMFQSFGSGPRIVLFDRNLSEVFEAFMDDDDVFAMVCMATQIFRLWLEGEFHWKSYPVTERESLDKLFHDDMDKWESDHKGFSIKDVYLFFMGVPVPTHFDVVEIVRNMYAFGTVCGRPGFDEYGRYFRLLFDLS